MNILGVIPARGGSKGVPNKNRRLLNSKPLIVHTIDKAIASQVFDKIIVSTDCEDIANIARDAGADVPFIRDAELATDSALAIPVIQDAYRRACRYYEANFDAVCMLQPTTPLRSGEDFQNVRDLLVNNPTSDSVISVVAVSQHPHKMVRKSEDGYMMPFLDWPVENPPRQSLPDLYTYNGAFYLTRTSVLMGQNSFKGQSCHLYEMPFDRSVNIDNISDFQLAEMKMSNSNDS